MNNRWIFCCITLGFLLSLDNVQADDQFLCCMKGIKAIRNIELCPAPCCPGYQRVVFYARKLSKIEFCEKALPDETDFLEGELATDIDREDADPD